ncbi:hypothetical protein [Pseudomonas phage Itty13]|uniref:Fe2OG dioxygenase domain-containing protein n=1 Tax=Pseudomonas phage Itty13 TaxID=2805750 RepID=A0A889IR97_9CAUD|nr:2OG-Fe(II) oxygenase [Pseudomonas phage Itty13]QRE00634.1 hypothetical protein [Pseudomonas phage Itty13]
MIHRLHPDLRTHLPALLEIITCAKEVTDDPERLTELIEEDSDWLAAWTWARDLLLSNRVTGLAGSAFGLPLLDPAYCDELVAHAERLGKEVGHRPNPEEESPYQIPELVLAHVAPELHAEVVELISFLNVWFLLIYQIEARGIASIQFAKYEPNGTAHGNWHHDRDSDLTAVVSLAPELHLGGGTDVRMSPVDYLSVPPLPKGYALVFDGKHIQHRGRAVEAGVRHLLVFWLTAAGNVPVSETAQVE